MDSRGNSSSFLLLLQRKIEGELSCQKVLQQLKNMN